MSTRGNVPRPSLNLPTPLDGREATVFAELTRADGENYKRTGHIALPYGQHLVLQSPNGTWWEVTISNAGVLTTSSTTHP